MARYVIVWCNVYGTILNVFSQDLHLQFSIFAYSCLLGSHSEVPASPKLPSSRPGAAEELRSSKRCSTCHYISVCVLAFCGLFGDKKCGLQNSRVRVAKGRFVLAFLQTAQSCISCSPLPERPFAPSCGRGRGRLTPGSSCGSWLLAF